MKRRILSISLASALAGLALCALVIAGPGARAVADDQAPAATTKVSPHDRSLIGERDCSECHTPAGWSLSGDGGGFDHAQTGFPLTGTHASVQCIDCHVGNRTITRDCSNCHRDAHQGRLGIQCDQCHNTRNFRDTRAIERHRRTRLPLTGVHAVLPCSSCHIRTAGRSSGRTYAPVPATCFSCHEKDYRSDIHPVHQGDANDPSLAQFPRDCEACHRPIAWSPAVLDPRSLQRLSTVQQSLRDHDRHFPLSFGKHRGARCESCHLTTANPRLLTCTGCHNHSPARLRMSHQGKAVASDAAGCLRCHPGGIAR
ncbi:cytochrome c3 family protein [Haliangium ochraceum]|uniref:Cytochrome c family protein n=1 Tax=Haliangium ochraceum (strain DSM 14365 / JCM 11303 / SMP-2) TaxID=502025 RepID=D0LK57_HALO1|nr:cytochrome c3 family protein [Haliangium ochraceum]ACY13091.1 cytochrome c family protein [Haliangium ochraceum DSM 14365]